VFPIPIPVRRRVLFQQDLPDNPDMGVYVLTHIHEREQLPHERLVTALAGRVDNEGGAPKICAASPARKETLCASPSSSELCVTGRIESADNSMPVALVK
jgi:hypothetical protein